MIWRWPAPPRPQTQRVPPALERTRNPLVTLGGRVVRLGSRESGALGRAHGVSGALAQIVQAALGVVEGDAPIAQVFERLAA